MKKIFYIILFACLTKQFFGQTNLVINPSFEEYSSCPDFIGKTYLATGWDNFTGSGDYFNVCGTSGTGVPGNSFGYQTPFNGNAYCGIITYYSNALYREIIGGTLQTPLTVSQKYYFSFRTSRGSDPIIGYSSNKIGIKLTQTNSYTTNISNYSITVNNFAQYLHSTVITDTLNWIQIKGSFVADSAYKYIMIGNFSDDANTTISNQTSSAVWAYYYIDDVCVSTDSTFASNWTGLKETSSNVAFKVYPNPVSEFISFATSQYNKQGKVLLIDKYGQIILDKDIPTSNKIDISNIPVGLYFIQITSDGKTYWDKILVYH
jgi:hypothetical protein